ncbi:hypothetical protein pb186bvf_020830 [Paramecium bursaria]
MKNRFSIIIQACDIAIVLRRTRLRQERVISQSSDKSPNKYVDALRHFHKTLHS